MAKKAQLTFNIIGEKHSFIPFEPISGHVEWEAAGDSNQLKIKLLWSVEQSEHDYGIVEELVVNTDTDAGLKSFSFTLPDRPHSCRGELVSIQWQLEAVMGKTVVVYDFVLSADGHVIELASIDDPSLTKMKRWKKKIQRKFIKNSPS